MKEDKNSADQWKQAEVQPGKRVGSCEGWLSVLNSFFFLSFFFQRKTCSYNAGI